MKARAVGEIVRELREAAGLTQAEFAGIVGYADQTAVSKLENGERGLTARKRQVIRDYFGVTDSYLDDVLIANLSALGCGIENRDGDVLITEPRTKTQVFIPTDDWLGLRNSGDVGAVYDRLFPFADLGAYEAKSSIRTTLYKLIDSLPDDKLSKVEGYLQGLKDQ